VTCDFYLKRVAFKSKVGQTKENIVKEIVNLIKEIVKIWGENFN
jgi:hypothetical protein